MTPNFARFDPPVKIKGGVGEIPIPTVQALPTTESPKYIFDGRPLAAWLLNTVD